MSYSLRSISTYQGERWLTKKWTLNWAFPHNKDVANWMWCAVVIGFQLLWAAREILKILVITQRSTQRSTLVLCMHIQYNLVNFSVVVFMVV